MDKRKIYKAATYRQQNSEIARAYVELVNQIKEIADTGILPDGDHVELHTAMYFERWRDELVTQENKQAA